MAEEQKTSARFYGAFRAENDDVNEFANDVSFSVSTAHKSATGVSVKTVAKSVAGDKGPEPLVASVFPSYTFVEYDTTVDLAFNQKVAGSTGEFRLSSIEAGLQKENPFGLKGSNLGGGLVYNQKNTTNTWLFKGNFDFSNHLLAAQLDGTYELGKGVTDGSVSAAVTHSNFSFGGVWNKTEDSEPPKEGEDDEDSARYAVGVAYHKDKISGQLHGTFYESKKTVDLDVWHQCSDNNQWTLNVQGTFNKDNKYEGAEASVGSLYEFDDNTNFKGRTTVTNALCGRADVAFTRKLTPNVGTTVGANFPLFGPQTKGVSLGLQLEIE